MASVLLIGDIGGTNARFALAGSKRPGFSFVHTAFRFSLSTLDAKIQAGALGLLRISQST